MTMLLQHKAPPLETFVSNHLRLHHVDDTSKDIPQREHRLKIVVVGGVAGGMSFAARARRLSESATITVFEKGPLVGYASCGIPYALGGILSPDTALILQTPETVNARYNVDVRVGSEVINIDREKKTVEYTTENGDTKRTGYDKLVLAQGAEPFRPSIPGLDTPNLFNLQTISDMENIKCYLATHNSRSAAIIGGGFIGMEAAESLRTSGVDVSVVEYMPHVFRSIDQDIAEPLHAEIRKNGVDLYLNAKVREIRRLMEPTRTSEIVLESGDRVLANVIILVTGVNPRTALAQQADLEVNCLGVVTDSHMRTTDPDIYAIGDMACTMDRVTNTQQNLALAGPANRQGRLVADHIFGRDVSYRGNVGTSVCQVFGLNVGLVGPSISRLRAWGLVSEYITVHPLNHVSYYPGSSPMTVKLAFSMSSGKIFGAQVIGEGCITKPVDVIATCIQANMTVYDLEHLELAYAPPFGSAKSAVNMAGFVASNVLRGDTKIIHAEDLNPEILENYQVVDVRSAEEFANGCIRGAVLLPLEGLREQSKSGILDRYRKTLVYCQAGYRGYMAFRILHQAGFDVVNLDGGFKQLKQGGYLALIAQKIVK